MSYTQSGCLTPSAQCEQPVKEANIKESMNQINNSIDRLAMQIDRIATRLEPVLSPAVPTIASNCKEQPVPQKSAISRFIDEKASNINELAAQIIHIIDRIEL